MSDLVTRPIGDFDTDAALIADAMNAIDIGDGGEPGWATGEIRAMLTGWMGDPTTDSRLVVAPDGTLAAVGIVAAPPPGGDRADAFGGVVHAYRDRGIGRELFGWQVARIRELHAERAPDDAWHMDTSTLTGDEKAGRFLARFGMKPVRYEFEMVAEPSAARPRPVPDGLTVVPYTDELAERLWAAHQEAFADHWNFQFRPYDNWIGLTVGSEPFRADVSRIALDGDEVAAYVLAYGHDDSLYVGQVGTRRPWRGRGLASVLLGDVLAAATEFAEAALIVDADSPTGAVGVYERAGFTVRMRFTIYHGDV